MPASVAAGIEQQIGSFMRIAIVNRHISDELGGSEMQCDNIATEFKARGHDVSYIAPGGKQADYHRTYNVIKCGSDGNSIGNAVVSVNPDVVYWRFNKNFFYKSIRTVRSVMKNRTVFLFAVSHIDDTRKFNYLAAASSGVIPFLKAVKQAAVNCYNYRGYRRVDAITYLNADFVGLIPAKIQKFVPNSVSTASIDFDWPRPFVAWVANIKKNKRPDKFLELASTLADCNVDFLMIGSIFDKEYQYIENVCGTGNFHYLGPKSVEEVNGILDRSLLLVHTCRPEGFGNNFLQAWLKSKPTVSFGFDPGGYISEHSLGGVAHDDWDVFVSQVRSLLLNDNLRNETGARAYDFAQRTFSIARTVDELLTVIDKAKQNSPAVEG
jgi:glycosyltransferase involved in cell wall biosynthesis